MILFFSTHNSYYNIQLGGLTIKTCKKREGSKNPPMFCFNEQKEIIGLEFVCRFSVRSASETLKIMFWNTFEGEDDNSDNEQEGFPEDIPAEFDGGPDFISPGITPVGS